MKEDVKRGLLVLREGRAQRVLYCCGELPARLLTVGRPEGLGR